MIIRVKTPLNFVIISIKSPLIFVNCVIVENVSLEQIQADTSLNESYIIFICTFDPFEKGLSHYTFKTRCLQDSEVDIKDGKTANFSYRKSCPCGL